MTAAPTVGPPDPAQTRGRLEQLLSDRIVVLDGATGTMMQREGLDEADFRGEVLRDHPEALKGNNDVLVLTRPDVVRKVHRAFLEAGADIIETNTFSAQVVSQADYGLEAWVPQINREAARLARLEADAFSAADPSRPRFVAGSLGPTTRTLSLSPKVEDPGYRAIEYEAMRDAYFEQALALIEGGVHLLLVETIIDTLNAKAACDAVERAREASGLDVPLIVSLTLTDQSGRTLSGQTLEAFWVSIEHTRPLAVGLNCALGADQMRPFVAEMARLCDVPVICYPNAGLPNELGEYDEAPEHTGAVLRRFAQEGWLNGVGGCCGTTPAHVAAIAGAVAGLPPRRIPERPARTRFAGLEPLELRDDMRTFTMIGERTNVTGSRRFARLIRTGDFDAALQVALDQVRGGANVLDVNMDEGLLDAVAAMTRFLKLIAAEPEIARLPIMIDSSRFEVIEAGLQCVQGKAIANSISLKEGEAAFKEQARVLRRFGAAAVVMAFDETGQATGVDDRVAIAERVWRILTEEVGFPGEDILFDPNVLAVATGIEEHDRYALNFIEAARAIKQRWPRMKLSGGISNLSFAFRGNDVVREAMHAAFLFHAIDAGLDMGIVNAGQLAVYDDLPDDLLERVEDALFCRRADATERLVDFASQVQGSATARVVDEAWRAGDVAARLEHALVHGVLDHLESDVDEALAALGEPLAVIEGPLMDGMNEVGERFGAGKMFLPQVVKSARAMKKAVARLTPLMEAQRAAGATSHRGRVLLATVKGDVHDIGKNIVGVVLGCNGYDVVDLGVMVPAGRILAEARDQGVDMIGLSGLITPSLDEMVHVAGEMQRENFELPLLIGGATTSRKHTAVKIAPAYEGPVVHVRDASRAVGTVGALRSDDQRATLLAENVAAQEAERARFAQRRAVSLHPVQEARARRLPWDAAVAQPARPAQPGVHRLRPPLEELARWIDWTPFFHTWELKGRFPRILDDPKKGAAARELHANALALLERIVAEGSLEAMGVWGLFPAASEGDDLLIYEDEGRRAVRARIPMLRQQRVVPGDGERLCLADYVAPADSGDADWLGAFAVTAGHGVEALVARFEGDHDDYSAIMARALADRLAEAFAEWLHAKVRRELWGYAPDEAVDAEAILAGRYRGIRPAPGYPACPDHLPKRSLFALLDAPGAAGMALTDGLAMTPAASVSGWYLAHPQARYFAVGAIGRDQARSYAERWQLPLDEAERHLGPSLAYDPAEAAS